MPGTETDYAAEIVWGLIYGELRGRIPYPIPYDLLAVAVSACVRWTEFVRGVNTVEVNGDLVVSIGTGPRFIGFTLTELVTLWRYRVRTGLGRGSPGHPDERASYRPVNCWHQAQLHS